MVLDEIRVSRGAARWTSNFTSSYETCISQASHGFSIGDMLALKSDGTCVKATNSNVVGIVTHVPGPNRYHMKTTGPVVPYNPLPSEVTVDREHTPLSLTPSPKSGVLAIRLVEVIENGVKTLGLAAEIGGCRHIADFMVLTENEVFGGNSGTSVCPVEESVAIKIRKIVAEFLAK